MGSAPKPKTIGIVVVAAFAARTAATLPDATRTATPRSTRSLAQVRKPIFSFSSPMGFNCYVATFEVVLHSEPFGKKQHFQEYEAFDWAIIEMAHQRKKRQLLRIGLDRAGDRGP